jgi:hypothetical protein
MDTLIDRRLPSPGASRTYLNTDTSEIVRHGILLRACLGTIGAVEYLKTHGTCGAIITRVLAGERMRDEDATALAQCKADLERGN